MLHIPLEPHVPSCGPKSKKRYEPIWNDTVYDCKYDLKYDAMWKIVKGQAMSGYVRLQRTKWSPNRPHPCWGQKWWGISDASAMHMPVSSMPQMPQMQQMRQMQRQVTRVSLAKKLSPETGLCLTISDHLPHWFSNERFGCAMTIILLCSGKSPDFWVPSWELPFRCTRRNEHQPPNSRSSETLKKRPTHKHNTANWEQHHQTICQDVQNAAIDTFHMSYQWSSGLTADWLDTRWYMFPHISLMIIYKH